MAIAAGLGQGRMAIGLFRAARARADLAESSGGSGSTELLCGWSGQLAAGAASDARCHWRPGAADDAALIQSRSTGRARMLSGADCERDDELKTAFARLLARQMESCSMVLQRKSLASKGYSELPLLIQPSMAVAGYLLALLEAGSASQAGTAGDLSRPGPPRGWRAEGNRGVLENMVAGQPSAVTTSPQAGLVPGTPWKAAAPDVLRGG